MNFQSDHRFIFNQDSLLRALPASALAAMDASAAPWDLWLGETNWPAEPVGVFGASGGACLLRREMLDDIGLFEESFFAYLEDADLAWRAQVRGWKTLLTPDCYLLRT